MRILIASKRAPDRPGRRPGGVQTWVATIAAELTRQGHEVVIADALIKPDGFFDIGILSNMKYTGSMAQQCDRTVNVCHGIVEDEKPVNGAVFTSEGVAKHWGSDGIIIRQPIDTDFWSPAKAQRRYLTRFSPRGGLEFMHMLAASTNMQFMHIKQAPLREIRNTLRQSVCVFASGRASLEAMACGVPVVIADHRGYQGALMDADPIDAMHRNYSGRGGVVPRYSNALEAMQEAIKAGSLRDHVVDNHNVQTVTQQLMDAAV